jgi:Neuraminidase (sialidase)
VCACERLHLRRDATIAYSQSTDGGAHWSTPLRINQVATTQAFTAQVFVSSDATVGVT